MPRSVERTKKEAELSIKDAKRVQLANSPDEEQAAAAAAVVAAAAAGPVAAAIAAAAADYAERSAMAPDAIQAPTPSNSMQRSAVRNPYTRDSTLASSLLHPVQLTERITLTRESNAHSRNATESEAMDEEEYVLGIIVGGEGSAFANAPRLLSEGDPCADGAL